MEEHLGHSGGLFNKGRCAANCAVIVTAHDASGDTGQNCDRGILSGNCEFWPVSSELDGIRFGLANRRLRPLGHLTAEANYKRRRHLHATKFTSVEPTFFQTT